MTEEETYQPHWFMKIKKFISVEPILLAVAIPLYLQNISMQNLALEKSCRVNLAFSAIVCDNMIDKSMNGINCRNVTLDANALNEISHESNLSVNNGTVDFHYHSYFTLQQNVCRAEIESQKLISTISGYMAPFESVLGVFTILIGGYISDNSGRRKPIILYPIIGQFLSQVVYLVAAIFMTELPVQFVTVLGPIIIEMTGGYSLLFMALSCYLAEITKEKDRVFRFGLLYQLFPLMSICTLPFAGILYQKLGYIRLSLIGLIFIAISITYVIFVLKEPQVVLQKNLQNTERKTTPRVDSHLEMKESKTIEGGKCDQSDHQSWFEKFQNCDAVRNVVSVVMRRRSERGRMIVWLLLLCNFVSVGCEYEFVNEYFFVRTKLNWEALDESPFAAYTSATAFFGNIFMFAILSKYFHVPNAVIGLIASTCSSISKIFCITVSTTFMLYVARSFDLFAGSYSVANRSIMSLVVNKNEIGRIFSLMGVLENFSKLIFLPIYSITYKRTVETFPNAYFVVSFVGMSFVTVIFGNFAIHFDILSLHTSMYAMMGQFVLQAHNSDCLIRILCCYVKNRTNNSVDISTTRLHTRTDERC